MFTELLPTLYHAWFHPFPMSMYRASLTFNAMSLNLNAPNVIIESDSMIHNLPSSWHKALNMLLLEFLLVVGTVSL